MSDRKQRSALMERVFSSIRDMLHEGGVSVASMTLSFAGPSDATTASMVVDPSLAMGTQFGMLAIFSATLPDLMVEYRDKIAAMQGEYIAIPGRKQSILTN